MLGPHLERDTPAKFYIVPTTDLVLYPGTDFYVKFSHYPQEVKGKLFSGCRNHLFTFTVGNGLNCHLPQTNKETIEKAMGTLFLLETK